MGLFSKWKHKDEDEAFDAGFAEGASLAHDVRNGIVTDLDGADMEVAHMAEAQGLEEMDETLKDNFLEGYGQGLATEPKKHWWQW